ncbi:MAG: hypothetical protein JO263_01780 [Candidatus Eremiobacteraeota bacterium]|nr:hypothetical protein [Candidatus Eremiobacteraeota bacterium]
MIERDDEYLDFSQVPESKGVPEGLYRVVVLGLLVIFAIGGAVCLMSGYGHHWPAATTERVPLNNPAP